MVSLRTMWGIRSAEFLERFGEEYANYFAGEVRQHLDRGNIELIAGTYTLTEKAKFFADGIAADLFRTKEGV